MGTSILDQLDRYGPEHCPASTPEQASAYVQELARTHYENFSVVSWFLPQRLRTDFRHVYAFCRWADDLGDEAGSPQRSLELLGWWRRELDLCYAGAPRHPVFVALKPTVDRHGIPRKPFDDLIDAFEQDQRINRYRSWSQVLDYCKRSADPVGRLVLYLCGYRDTQRQELSDATCTALQLANFWQDVRRDILERDRVYLPSEIASDHGLDVDTLVAAVKADATGSATAACCDGRRLPGVGVTALLGPYRQTLRDLCDRTWPLFVSGRRLWPLVARDVRLDIQLFTLGGEAVLRMIRARGYDTLTSRPSVSKPAKLGLMMRALASKWLGVGLGRDAVEAVDSGTGASPAKLDGGLAGGKGAR